MASTGGGKGSGDGKEPPRKLSVRELKAQFEEAKGKTEGPARRTSKERAPTQAHTSEDAVKAYQAAKEAAENKKKAAEAAKTTAATTAQTRTLPVPLTPKPIFKPTGKVLTRRTSATGAAAPVQRAPVPPLPPPIAQPPAKAPAKTSSHSKSVGDEDTGYESDATHKSLSGKLFGLGSGLRNAISGALPGRETVERLRGRAGSAFKRPDTERTDDDARSQGGQSIGARSWRSAVSVVSKMSESAQSMASVVGDVFYRNASHSFKKLMRTIKPGSKVSEDEYANFVGTVLRNVIDTITTAPTTIANAVTQEQINTAKLLLEEERKRNPNAGIHKILGVQAAFIFVYPDIVRPFDVTPEQKSTVAKLLANFDNPNTAKSRTDALKCIAGGISYKDRTVHIPHETTFRHTEGAKHDAEVAHKNALRQRIEEFISDTLKKCLEYSKKAGTPKPPLATILHTVLQSPEMRQASLDLAWEIIQYDDREYQTLQRAAQEIRPISLNANLPVSNEWWLNMLDEFEDVLGNLPMRLQKYLAEVKLSEEISPDFQTYRNNINLEEHKGNAHPLKGTIQKLRAQLEADASGSSTIASIIDRLELPKNLQTPIASFLHDVAVKSSSEPAPDLGFRDPNTKHAYKYTLAWYVMVLVYGNGAAPVTKPAAKPPVPPRPPGHGAKHPPS